MRSIFCRASWEIVNKLCKSCSMAFSEWKIKWRATKASAQIGNYTSNKESFYVWMQNNLVMKNTQEENSKHGRHPICRREGEADAGKELRSPCSPLCPELRKHSSFHPQELLVPALPSAPVLVKPGHSPALGALRSRIFLGF